MKQSFDPINADPISDELWSNHSTSSMLIMLMTSYEEINEGLIDALVLRRYSFGNWITSGLLLKIWRSKNQVYQYWNQLSSLENDQEMMIRSRIWSKFNVESKEDFLSLYSHIVCKFCVKFYDLKTNNVSWYQLT